MFFSWHNKRVAGRAQSSGTNHNKKRHLFALATACAVYAMLVPRVFGAEVATSAVAGSQPLSLQECVETALENNRVLQVERINPRLARLAVDGSYGYYSPVFTSQVQWERDTDTGGFDPADFSRDAIYSARSEVANAGLVGFLPSGLSYSLTGAYAHSDGTRNSLDFDSYKLDSSISVRQPLLRNFWTDQGRTTIALNRKLLSISELGVAYIALDIINQVQQCYFELLFAHEYLQAQQGLLAVKQATFAGVRRQVQVGMLTSLEERLARSEIARVDAQLIAASNSVVLAENALRTHLGQTYATWTSGALIPAGRLLLMPESLQLSESWHSALNSRPDLAQMRRDFERAGIEVKFRKNQLFPSVDVVAAYGRRGANAIQALPPAQADASASSAWNQIEDGDAPNHMVGVVFSTPLTRASEKASYRAGKLLQEQAALRLKQKEELILREVSDAVQNARFAWDRAHATRQAREFAASALEAEEQKLAGGKSSLFMVYQLQGDLADAQFAEARARADYNKAVSQLHFAEASLLERYQISVQQP